MSGDGYKMLFSTGKIGSLELKNRIIMPPMVTNYATEDGAVTEQYKDYLRERANGGVGLIIVEATYIHPWGKGFVNNLGVDRDELVPGLRELTEVAHGAEVKIAIQLYHAGRQTSSKTSGYHPIAPSPIPTPGEEEIPREATIEEIQGVVEAFGEGARRAKEAGFDAVEVHGTHGYIINEFLSPYSNKREDEYGKDFEGRLRLALEVLQRIKEKAGNEFPVIYRINGDECVEGGITLEVTKRIAKRLEEAGADAFHVTAGVGESSYNSVQPMAMPRGCKAHLAQGVKQVVNVPIISAGRINHPEVAEEILEQNKADFVAMGRALLCDQEMPNKALEGEIDDIRVCIACNQKCINKLLGAEQEPIGCALNVRTGREAEFPMTKVDKKKKVLIVGAGPAGLEAARVAALRGHRVDLFEKEERIGGQINLISSVPGREEFKEVISYYQSQIPKLGINLVLNHPVSAEEIEGMSPDVVIFATGATPLVPDLPGIDSPQVVRAWDVIRGECALGERVVVLGGGSVGACTVDSLRKLGKKVTIVEMLEDIALDMEPLTRKLFIKELISDGKVEIWTGTRISEISEEGILVERGWEKILLRDIDNVVLALGATSNKDLIDKLAGKLRNYHVVGDAKKPRKVTEAVEEGFEAAYRI